MSIINIKFIILLGTNNEVTERNLYNVGSRWKVVIIYESPL